MPDRVPGRLEHVTTVGAARAAAAQKTEGCPEPARVPRRRLPCRPSSKPGMPQDQLDTAIRPRPGPGPSVICRGRISETAWGSLRLYRPAAQRVSQLAQQRRAALSNAGERRSAPRPGHPYAALLLGSRIVHCSYTVIRYRPAPDTPTPSPLYPPAAAPSTPSSSRHLVTSPLTRAGVTRNKNILNAAATASVRVPGPADTVTAQPDAARRAQAGITPSARPAAVAGPEVQGQGRATGRRRRRCGRGRRRTGGP